MDPADPHSPSEPRPASRAPAAGSTSGLVRAGIVYGLLFGAAGAFLPYVAIYLGSTGLDLGAVGALIALQAAVTLIAAPGWGAIADGIGDVRRPLLVAGVLAAIASVFLLSARGPLAIGVAIILLAGTSAGMIPLVDSRTVRMVGHRDRFGQARAVGSAAYIVFALLTGVLIGRFGPIGIFGPHSVLLLLTGIGAWALMRLPPGDPGVMPRRRRGGPARFAGMALSGLAPATILSVLREPPVRVFFVATVVLWTSQAALQNFVSLRIIELGGNATIVGATSSLSALVEIPLMALFPALARRFGPERLVVIGAAGFAIRALISAVVTDPVLIAGAAVFGGVGFAFVYVGTVTWVSASVRREIQATAQGVFSGTGISLGAIGGSIVGGAIGATFSLPVLFIIAGIGYALGGLIVWIWIVRRPAGPGVPTADPPGARADDRPV